MNEFNYDNEIIEINDEEEKVIEVVKEEKPNNIKKPSKKQFKLSKKQIIIIIVVGSIILLGVIALILFNIFKDDKKEEVPKQDEVILEKDNYRYENGNLVFLDNNDLELGTYKCKITDTEKCLVTKILLNDNFDRVKNIYEDGTELIKSSKIYNERFVFVSDNDKVYLYDFVDNDTLLELSSIKIYNTERDIVVIEDDNHLYGLIEINDDGFTYLIRPSYNNLGIVNELDVLLLAQDKDKNYIIDSSGKTLSKDIKVEVKFAKDNYVVGYTNETYNLYNYEYEELISDYDYISIHNGVISLVKNKRLYLYDAELNKLYEDGKRLENTNYTKKYVYSKNNRLVETLKSYEIEVKDNIVSIIIGEDTTDINMYEGKISSTYKYMSYYDKKLYFYSDEEKNDLLGTYTCNNENKLDTASSILTSCNLYTNEVGISGIYNNEYVFIKDSSDSETLYYLYNLKEKKIKGTYTDIKILDSEIHEEIKPLYTSESYIVAKSGTGSNKGNYGVLQINSEGVSGKIAFKYESIEKEKEYYILKNIDKTYSIYDSKFNKISNEFSFVKLYDKYYVGINNNKLNIFEYGKSEEILESGISIEGTTFEVDFTDGFTITINKEVYKYDKLGKVKKDELDRKEENNTEEDSTDNSNEEENNAE